MEEKKYNNNGAPNRRFEKPKNPAGDLLGKVYPQAVQLEEAVLGAIMMDRDAMSTVLDILKAATFYREEHKVIFEAMMSLFQKGAPIDLLTVTEELKKIGTLEKVGGYFYVAELTNKVASAANIEYHARIISQKYIQRELIQVATAIQREAFDDTADALALMDDAERRLFAVTETHLTKSYESVGALTGKFLKSLEDLAARGNGLTGVPTGYINLDRLTSGWQRSDLIVIAARPGMGKTSLVLALARNAAMDFGKPVVMFSLEMANLQLVQRLVALEAEIEIGKFRNGNLDGGDFAKLNTAVERVSKAPIFFDDTSSLNIFELRAKCRRLKMQHNIELIIIDYIQLMTGGVDGRGTNNREQEIAQISRSLKALAKELNVPIIALSQLSRAVESRGGIKRPQLSDLRESGAIEQDADQVAFIYRPEYYGIPEDEEGNSTNGLAELIFAKNRHGAGDTVKLRFIKQYTKFADWDDGDFNNLGGGNLTPMKAVTQGANQEFTTAPSRMNNNDEVPF